MLCMTYFELGENVDLKKMIEKAAEMMQKGMYPPEGIKLVGNYVSAGGNWGVTVYEAESEEAAYKEANVWRVHTPGFFKLIKQTVAMTAEDAIKFTFEL